MKKQEENSSIVELSAANLKNSRKVRRNEEKWVKIRPKPISIHFRWALISTIFCFFTVGPCWALYKTRRVRRLVKNGELDRANVLSNKISVILVISMILGVFAWVAFLFCSVGLLLTGKLLLWRLI